MKIECRQPRNDDEYEQMVRITIRAFGGTEPGTRQHFFRDVDHLGRDWRNSRILVSDGRVLSAIQVYEYRLRIGAAVTRMAGIAWVATDPDHRQRGYAARVMEDALQFARARRCTMSMLFGIPNYYDRFGFVSALNSACFELSTAAAPSRCGRLRWRNYRHSDFGAVQRLRRQLERESVCAVVREKKHWGRLSRRLRAARIGIEGDHVRAYLFGAPEEGEWRLYESAVPNKPELFEDVLAEAARLARKSERDVLTLVAPPDTALVRYARQFGGRLWLSRRRNAGGMACLLDVGQALRDLAPELQRRLTRGGLIDAGPMTLHTDAGTAMLELRAGRLTVGDPVPGARLTLPQQTLTQLLLGYRDIDQVRREDGLRAPRQELPMLRALFPAAEPSIWPADHF